jgi:alpha-1,6-mannosyltransferase
MKICDIVQFYSSLSGGVKRYINDKIRYFYSQPDIEHVVIVPSDRDHVRMEGRTRIYEMKSMRMVGSSSYRLLVSRRRIREVIELETPDIIEVGDPYHTAWISHGIARKMNIPIVAYYHSDYPRAFGRTMTKYGGRLLGRMTERLITRYLTRLYNRMDATVVATPVLEDLLRGIGIQRIIRVPLGTDTERFHPIDQRAQVLNDLGLPQDAKLLLYVGRMAREKNVLNLIRMMECFPDDSRIALLLVGDGEQSKQIQRMAQQCGTIFWHPYCNSPELLSVFYSAADAFVHPGTNETFGLVSLEAQSCGAPVVAVRDGGVEATLAHEPAAGRADSASPRDLCEAVQTMLGRNETWEDRMERRTCIIRFYGRDTTCRLMVDLYELVYADHNALAVAVPEMAHPLYARR